MYRKGKRMPVHVQRALRSTERLQVRGFLYVRAGDGELRILKKVTNLLGALERFYSIRSGHGCTDSGCKSSSYCCECKAKHPAYPPASKLPKSLISPL